MTLDQWLTDHPGGYVLARSVRVRRDGSGFTAEAYRSSSAYAIGVGDSIASALADLEQRINKRSELTGEP